LRSKFALSSTDQGLAAAQKARRGRSGGLFLLLVQSLLPLSTSFLSLSQEPDMSLKDQITEDMKNAMRAHESTRLGTIRLLLAAVKQKEVDERVVVDDVMMVGIIDKLIKQRKDSVAAYTQAQRMDLADKESEEIKVLSAYLPQRLGAEEITAAVAAIVAQLGAKGPADMGKVMGAVKTQLAGKADMALVSQAVKAALAA